jgi:hypothetical protein
MDASFARRNLVPIVLGVASLAWVIGYVVRLGSTERKDDSIARARAELAACLLGPPFEPWMVEDRLRRIDIAVASDAAEPDWPMRCSDHAAALERLFETPEDPLLGNATASARLRRGRLYEDLRVAREIIELLRPAPGEPEVDVPAAAVPAPAPADLVTEPTSWPQGPSRASGGTADLALLMQRAVCRFGVTPTGLEPVARCTYFPDTLARDAQVYGIVAGPSRDPILLARGTPISLATGEPMMASAQALQSFSVLEDRTLAALASDALVVGDPDGAERRLSLDRPRGEPAETAVLVGDHLMWTEAGALFARSVVKGGFGPVVEVGRPPVASVPFTGPDGYCAHDGVLGAWIESEPDATRRGAEYRIVARVEDSWVFSDPVRGRLDCLADAVVVTRTRHDDSGSTITRTECASTGCRTTEIGLPEVTERSEAAPIGDFTVLVWVDDLVRARIAPFSELPHASTIALFDGYRDHRYYEFHGQSIVRRLALHVRGDSAIVELHADDTVGVHLDADGSVQPVRVVYE